MVETTFASISSSVRESTGNPTEIAIRASTSQSFATSLRRFFASDVVAVSSVKNFLRRRRFRGWGGPELLLGWAVVGFCWW